MPEKQPQLSLGWQVVCLVVCLFIGEKLTDAYGARVAGLLHAEFECARILIVIFFAAVAAIVGILAYRGMRIVARRGR